MTLARAWTRTTWSIVDRTSHEDIVPPYSPYGDTNKLETNIAIKLFVLKNSNCWEANKPTGMIDLPLKVVKF